LLTPPEYTLMSLMRGYAAVISPRKAKGGLFSADPLSFSAATGFRARLIRRCSGRVTVPESSLRQSW
jgi:hypothetical protein